MNGLLVVPPICGTMKNIGDYIQSIAQEQFWSKIDCYVERERMASFSSTETTNLIMNGWFMWHPNQFPPSNSINPFFISFHLSPSIAKELLTERSIEYLKKYEPIGCRDFSTLRILEKQGIKCYFSGCLTLTLGLNYISATKSDDIYISDLYFELGGSKKYHKVRRGYVILKELFYNFSKIASLRKAYSECKGRGVGIKGRLRLWAETASLYHTYSKYFSDDILLKAKFLTHIVDVKGLTENERLEKAKDFIKIYSKAKLVITSRIHAALPCLAVNTPVIFCTATNLAENGLEGSAGGRFEGLIDLMNFIAVSENKSINCSDSLKTILSKGKISYTSNIQNSKRYMDISKDLIKRTATFVKKSVGGGKIANNIAA